MGKCKGSTPLGRMAGWHQWRLQDDRKEGYDTSQEGFVMHTRKVETLEPFSSHVIPIKMMGAYLGECLNVMVQSLHVQDGTLSPGLTMQNMYTELRKGSKKAVVVVQNHTAYTQTLWKENPSGDMNDTCTVGTRSPRAR